MWLGSFRTHGRSKAHRDDRPQMVMDGGQARGAISIPAWCWSGNTAAVTVIEQVRADLWPITRVNAELTGTSRPTKIA